MTKTRLVVFVSLGLAVVGISNYYSYFYGFSSARVLTVSNILYLHVADLDSCLEDKSIECVKNVTALAKVKMCQLSRDLLDVNVGIDDGTKQWLTEIRDEIPMNCLDSVGILP